MSGYQPHDPPIGPDIEPDVWDAFVGDLRALAEEPPADVAGEHILAAASAVRENPAARPASTPSAVPLWRRRTVLTGLFSTILGKILVGTMAVAAATAGVGAAGALPDPVQGFVDDHVFQREQVRAEKTIQLGSQIGADEDKIIVKRERIRHQIRVEEPAGGTQTQQGGCEEEPCGTQSQSQSQTQTQTQTQQGECEEEPCGTQSQTQGECEEEPCGTEEQAQQGECEEGPCGEQGTDGSSQTQNRDSKPRP